MTTTLSPPPKATRSTVDMENLQEMVDTVSTPGKLHRKWKQQYETPPWLAEKCHSLLPTTYHRAVVDWQAAAGNLIHDTLFSWALTHCYGVDIDRRHKGNERDHGLHRITAHCVRVWQLFEELFPQVRFDCQVTNPPFGIDWDLPGGGHADSTEHTWNQMLRLTPKGYGCGFMISNHKTIERLGINKHPWVYLYHILPEGVWKQCEVEIGIVYYAACEHGIHEEQRFTSLEDFQALAVDPATARTLTAAASKDRPSYYQANTDHEYRLQAWSAIANIIKEESRAHIPSHNIYLDHRGFIRVYLSTFQKVKAKLSHVEIERLTKIDHSHPLTLTADRDSRKLLSSLVESEVYTLQPEARAAIESALADARTLAFPIMPATSFQAVAYADEEDTLTCRQTIHKLGEVAAFFTEGRTYEVKTGTYDWTSDFQRMKLHYSEKDGDQWMQNHTCRLSGTDRYVMVKDDRGTPFQFMDRPDEKDPKERPESELWEIFDQPQVPTIKELLPDKYAANLRTLELCEAMGGFKYFGREKEGL